MNKFRQIIVKFSSLQDLNKFYSLEFKFLKKFRERNIRINYRKSTINKIILKGYDNKIKFSSTIINRSVITHIFNLIDSMPMRKIDKKYNTPINLYNICGLQDSFRTSHCFNDYTHQTCCLLGGKARRYSNRSGNPIGKISEDIFRNYFNREPLFSDLTPWCTCIGSKVCSFYADKFNDGTHIKFINKRGSNFIVTGFNTNCEENIRDKLGYKKHMTPGIYNDMNNLTCKYNLFKY